MQDWQKDHKEAQAAGHHVDCDGYMTVHRVEIIRNEHGTWEAVCDECGKLCLGSASSSDAAGSLSAGHSQEVSCDGRCRHWDKAA